MYVFLKTWLALKADSRAVTALEYGLIAALIAGVIITAVAALGHDIAGMFWSVGKAVGGAKDRIQ
jgi:pilus assembly protein Flp/PilA